MNRTIQQKEEKRPFYNREIYHQIRRYLTPQQSGHLNDILQKRKPMTHETIKMLKVMIQLATQQRKNELKQYSEIAKTIIFLLKGGPGKQDSTGSILQLFYKNPQTEEEICGIYFLHETEDEIRTERFSIHFGIEQPFEFYTVRDFFKILLYIIEAFVSKSPLNYRNFIRVIRQSDIVETNVDIPLQPSVFSGQYLQRYPIANNWFVRFVFESYLQNVDDHPPLIHGRPEYLARAIPLRIDLPTTGDIARVLNSINVYIAQNLRQQQQR